MFYGIFVAVINCIGATKLGLNTSYTNIRLLDRVKTLQFGLSLCWYS